MPAERVLVSGATGRLGALVEMLLARRHLARLR
jgi:thioester reductase-like protein